MAKITLNIVSLFKNTTLPLPWVITICTIVFTAGAGYIHLKNDAEATISKINALPDSSSIVLKKDYLQFVSAQTAINDTAEIRYLRSIGYTGKGAECK